MSDDANRADRGDAVLAIFKRGAEFTRELVEENERLRGRLQDIESRQREAAQTPDDWDKLRHELIARIDHLESENRNIMEQLRAVEVENRQFAERYLEIEEENNNLANLYVASYQLHSTLDPSEVLKIIVEIVINLIGAEIFCVYVYHEDSEALEPVAAEGAELDAFTERVLTDPLVGQAVARGEVVCREPAEGRGPGPEGAPIVTIPLRIEDRPVGAIAVHRLLQQKTGFSLLDHELFTLLAGHAATAILASRLYAQSERKLSTIRGFIDLLSD